MGHMARVHALIAELVTSGGFIKGAVSRGDHLFVPKQIISYEEAISRVELTPNEAELQKLAALAPLDSSIHIRYALADAGFRSRDGQYVNDRAGVLIKIEQEDGGDKLYITTK